MTETAQNNGSHERVQAALDAHLHDINSRTYSPIDCYGQPGIELLMLALGGETFTEAQISAATTALSGHILHTIHYCYGYRSRQPGFSPTQSHSGNAILETLRSDLRKKEALDLQLPMYGTNGLHEFMKDFPQAKGILAEAATSEGRYINSAMLKIIAPTLGPQHIEKLNPLDAEALQIAIPMAKGTLSSEIKRMAMGLADKKVEEDTMADIAKALPTDLTRFFTDNLTKMFRIRAHGRKHAIFVVNLQDPPDDEMTAAVRTLSAMQHMESINLSKPFHIPAEESGDALCMMLIHLEMRARNTAGNLPGLPTEEQFRMRTLETQMQQKDLFENALEARDKLETKAATGRDATKRLTHLLASLAARWKTPEVDFLIHIQSLPTQQQPDAETQAILGRLLTMHTIGWLARYPSLRWLWNEPLTEKTARRLNQALEQMGLAKEHA
jgi:hypothetical protein